MKRLIVFSAILFPTVAEQLLVAKEQKKPADLFAVLFELPALLDVLLTTTREEFIASTACPICLLYTSDAADE